MELSKCLGCMEDFRGYPCPNCGYDPGQGQKNTFSLPPQTILYGKYLVGRVLGQGGFGITYIGWDIALERKVAIKEYYPSGQVSRSPGTRNLTWYTTEAAEQAHRDGIQMFLKEARKMSKVDGIPGVVRVLDLFQENGTAYIVMEFIEGVTLKAKLQKTGLLPWEQVREIFLSAIQTMAQVHKAGLVHRDLSPDNIMLLPDGSVKILDLGAAKDLSINSGASSMQVAKSGFSPLEQYTQRGGSGPWTDVYSMAATIYYTLTGKLPPNAIDRLETDTLSWDFPELNQLPAQARETLQKAMTVIAKNRLQTMDELGAGLSAQEVPQPKAKNPEPEKTESKSEPAPKAKKKPNKLVWIAAAAVVAVLCGIGIWTQVVKSANAHKQTLSVGYSTTVAVRYDGTVAIVGNNEYGQRDVGNWKHIAAVAAGGYHTVGLCKNGTVLAVGENQSGQCNVNDWRGIVDIAAGDFHTIGLHSDGTVVATGRNEYGQCNVSTWKDIVAVSADENYTVGLRSDGTVVATGRNSDGQCNVGNWRDIVAVDAGGYHTVGLCRDGTVVATGYNVDGQCNVDKWTDIVAVSAGCYHTAGLRSDGTVIATGSNVEGQCEVSQWKDIVAVDAGYWCTVGLRRDGTVVAAGSNDEGQCNVGRWSGVLVPNNIT